MPLVEGFNYNSFPNIPQGIENVSLNDDYTYYGVKGFVVDADGTLAVEMADGSSGTIVVIAGIPYPCAVSKFKSTGSVTVTAVTLFY